MQRVDSTQPIQARAEAQLSCLRSQLVLAPARVEVPAVWAARVEVSMARAWHPSHPWRHSVPQRAAETLTVTLVPMALTC